MAAQYRIFIDQGSPWARIFVYQNQDGSVVDLTGYGARMSFRREQSILSPLAIPVLTVGSGIVRIVGPSSSLQPTITPTMSNAMTLFSGWWDLYLDPNGSEDDSSYRILEGPFSVSPRVSL